MFHHLNAELGHLLPEESDKGEDGMPTSVRQRREPPPWRTPFGFARYATVLVVLYKLKGRKTFCNAQLGASRCHIGSRD